MQYITKDYIVTNFILHCFFLFRSYCICILFINCQ